MNFRSTVFALTLIGFSASCVQTASPNSSKNFKYNAMYCLAHIVTTTAAFGTTLSLGTLGFGIGMQLAQHPPFDTFASPYWGTIIGLASGLPLIYKVQPWTDNKLHQYKFLKNRLELTTAGSIIVFGARLALVAGLYYGFGPAKGLYHTLMHR